MIRIVHLTPTWLALVKPRPSQCTCSTPSLTSQAHGSKHGSSTSSSELSTRGVCVDVGVGVGVCDDRDRHTHPRVTARATHCILLLVPFSSAGWGYSPTLARHHTARQDAQHTATRSSQGAHNRSQLRMNQTHDTSQEFSKRRKIKVKSQRLKCHSEKSRVIFE